MKYKKIMSSFLIGITITISLVGCSGDSESANSTIDNKDIIELSFIRAGTSENTQLAYQKMIEDYEEANSNIKIEYQQVNFGEELETKLNTLYASGSAPDIVRAPISTIAQRASLGQYAPLDDYIDNWNEKDTIIDTAYDVATYQGNRYGIAVNVESNFLYYRKDHFEDAGLDPNSPPTNWDELLADSEILTIHDGETVTRAGTAIPTSKGHAVLIAFARQNGATLVDEINNIPTFNDAATAEALDYLAGYSKNNLLIPYIDNTDQNPFEMGNASIMIAALNAYSTLEANNPEWLDQVDFAPMPSGIYDSNFGGCQIYFISEESDYKDESWDFMKYLFGDEQLWEMVTTAGASPVKTTITDDFISEYGDLGQVYIDSLQYSQGMPKVEWAALFEKYISNAYEEAMYLQKDGTTALNDAMNDLESELN